MILIVPRALQRSPPNFHSVLRTGIPFHAPITDYLLNLRLKFFAH